MNNYPTPMNHLGAFGIVFALGVAAAVGVEWLWKQRKQS